MLLVFSEPFPLTQDTLDFPFRAGFFSNLYPEYRHALDIVPVVRTLRCGHLIGQSQPIHCSVYTLIS